MEFRWSSRRRGCAVCCRSAAVLLLTLLPGCGETAATDARTPVAVSGEIFLSGPTQPRVRVSCTGPVILDFCKLLDSGVQAEDQKDQGAAFLTIDYSDGVSKSVAITNTGLVRRDRKASRVNPEKLFALLEQMVRECSVANRSHPADTDR